MGGSRHGSAGAERVGLDISQRGDGVCWRFRGRGRDLRGRRVEDRYRDRNWRVDVMVRTEVQVRDQEGGFLGVFCYTLQSN